MRNLLYKKSRKVKDPAGREVEILEGADVVVDALDNVADRLLLEDASKALGIPLVHGALAGFEGQLMTIFPHDPGLKNLYGNEGAKADKSKSPESVLGVPTLTASLVLRCANIMTYLKDRARIQCLLSTKS